MQLTHARWALLRRGGLYLVIAAFAAFAVNLLPGTEQTAYAADSAGKKISRSEVIARAQYWVFKGLSYSSGSTYRDPDGDHSYRTDCSGFVDMAWHLGGQPNTGALPGYSGVSQISRSSLRKGDILNNASDGHVILFGGWAADDEHFTYYTFGATPPHKVTGASFGSGSLDGWPTSHYTAYTYSKLFDDTQGTTLESAGDGYACNHTAYWTVHLTDMRNVDLAADVCRWVQYLPATEQYRIETELVVHWRPGTGDDDSSNNSRNKFDRFYPHLQIQKNDGTAKELWCSGFKDRINSDFSDGDGVGDYVCHGSYVAAVGSGTWTADGWLEYDENLDGESSVGPFYLVGSPEVDL